MSTDKSTDQGTRPSPSSEQPTTPPPPTKKKKAKKTTRKNTGKPR